MKVIDLIDSYKYNLFYELDQLGDVILANNGIIIKANDISKIFEVFKMYKDEVKIEYEHITDNSIKITNIIVL